MIFRRQETIKLRKQTEELLAATYQAPISLMRPQFITSRPNICRFQVATGPAEMGKSLIVKRLPDVELELAKAASYPSVRYRFFNDWAGLQFLTALVDETDKTPISPHLYAAQQATTDNPTDLIVMEDIKALDDVVTILTGKEAKLAEEAMLQWAAVLGKLQARTIGKEALYKRIRDNIASRRPSWGWVPHWQRTPDKYASLVQTLPEEVKQAGFEGFAWLRFVLHQATDALSLAIPPAAEADLELVIEALSNPGTFLAYVHGDPCPGGNCMAMGKEVRLIDFENGDFRHALLDIAYARISFPTCWEALRLPHSLILRIEQAYRTEFVKGCPEASNDQRFSRELVHACAYWTLLLCQFNALAQFPNGDNYWKRYKMCQRFLTRFESFAQATREFGYLEELGSLFQAMAKTLQARWPAQSQPLPIYPAFLKDNQK